MRRKSIIKQKGFKSFEETVRAMSISEIILAMVEGLEKPYVKIDMDTYGSEVNNVCYGCAATNTICRIYNKKPIFTPDKSWYGMGTLGVKDIKKPDTDFIDYFESAIEKLRQGQLDDYNYRASTWCGGIALIPESLLWEYLPTLTNTYDKEDLQFYKEFAKKCEEAVNKRKK